MELKTSSSFKTTGLLEPWQTLCKIFSKCLTTRVTGWDQPPLQTIQMIRDDFTRHTTIKSSESQRSREEQRSLENKVELVNKHLAISRGRKGNIVEDLEYTIPPYQLRSLRIHTDLGCYGYLFEHLRAKFLSRKSFNTLADHLQEVMVESLPTYRQQNKEETDKMIAKAMLQERGKLQAKISSHIQKAIDTKIPSLVDASVRSYMSGHILHVHLAQPQTILVPEQQYQLSNNPHDDAHLEEENSAKQQNTSEYEAYVTGESSGQVNEKEQGQSSSRNQEQTDDYDFWTESYASDDDEILTNQVSQDIMKEVSLTIIEAELKKIADEMLRQRCTSGDEHKYHIDQMKNFLKSDIRDPEAPTLSLINQDLLYLKKGSLGPEKIVLSLHKFPAIIFNDVDIEERTSRWVNKCVKKFNPYARYGVEHWKNPRAKIFYIKRQKEPRKPK
ncbi:hypothetical protein Tco_1326640 [Tanacetum coccineum]